MREQEISDRRLLCCQQRPPADILVVALLCTGGGFHELPCLETSTEASGLRQNNRQ